MTGYININTKCMVNYKRKFKCIKEYPGQDAGQIIEVLATDKEAIREMLNVSEFWCEINPTVKELEINGTKFKLKIVPIKGSELRDVSVAIDKDGKYREIATLSRLLLGNIKNNDALNLGIIIPSQMDYMVFASEKVTADYKTCADIESEVIKFYNDFNYWTFLLSQD